MGNIISTSHLPLKAKANAGFSIGVAIADKPYGPFTPQATPIEGVNGIDPCVLIDKDGQAYIYWSGRGMSVAKLKDNMLELASEPMQIQGLPEGFKEGPFAFERNGKYYFTFPWVKEKTEVLAYAMGDNPMGPFEFKGIIMDESPTDCWTNHQLWWNTKTSGTCSITTTITPPNSIKTDRHESIPYSSTRTALSKK